MRGDGRVVKMWSAWLSVTANYKGGGRREVRMRELHELRTVYTWKEEVITGRPIFTLNLSSNHCSNRRINRQYCK